tara:strand:- start:1876 stop:2646 length:771 start_codon:yes stop_codon:yes gene_type:complete
MVYEFFKYQATGNDFIIIDDRDNKFDILDSSLIKSLCERKFGIGADGLILLRKEENFDFRMLYFNNDGKESTMCGNGGRCIIHFANLLDIISDNYSFLAIDGSHKGKIYEDIISLKMRDIDMISKYDDYFVVDSGSPHCVKFIDNLSDIDVNNEGQLIRNNKFFKKEGINVNFVDPESLSIRTFERGVEAETLSCGTGTVASAIILHFCKDIIEESVDISTKGGELSVSFQEFNGSYKNIWLSGPASLVFSGEFES